MICHDEYLPYELFLVDSIINDAIPNKYGSP